LDQLKSEILFLIISLENAKEIDSDYLGLIKQIFSEATDFLIITSLYVRKKKFIKDLCAIMKPLFKNLIIREIEKVYKNF
jgi:hypothetical protein